MRTTERFYFAQKAFVVNEGRILLVRKSEADPNRPGLWEVPGGRMKFGEKPEEHLIREVREETGITVEVGEPFFLWDWRIQRPGDEDEIIDMHIVAVARLCKAITMALSDKDRVADDFLDEMKWVPIHAIKEYALIPNMTPVVDRFLEIVLETKQ